MLVALYDIETNGLLTEKREKDGSVCPPMNTVHGISIKLKDLADPLVPVRRISACKVFRKGYHYYLPDQKPDEDGALRYTELADGDTPPVGALLWERMTIEAALRVLQEADIRVAHNGQDFDERALPRVYPWFTPKLKSKMLDTLLLSRLIYPDIHRTGPNSHRLFPFEKRMHGVAAWGKRLGQHKGEYTHWCKAQGFDPWAQWRPEMQAYQDFDVEALDTIFTWLWAQKPATTATTLEHEFAAIIRRMESWGWSFNRDKAEALLVELQTKATYLEAKLIDTFGEWWEYGKAANSKAENLKAKWRDDDDDEDEEDEEAQAKRAAEWARNEGYGAVIIPTKTMHRKLVGLPNVTKPRFSKAGKELAPYVGPPLLEITMGCPYTPIKRVQFNPSSRQHIWKRLIATYGWKPVKFTPGGKNSPPQPKIDEAVLRGLPYPEADLLAEYFLVLKRLGALAVGQKAWLKVVKETEHPNGKTTYRIHGRVNTCGATGGRCTHSDPNVSQVAANNAAVAEYPNSPELHGYRCRELFEATKGYIQAGFDGAALELRILAHYIHPWDNGEYARIVHEGRKEDGTDPHSWLRDLLGVDLMGRGAIGRDHAKTTMYAELYGGGALRLGEIIIPKGSDAEKREVGLEVKAKMAERFVAKASLTEAIKSVAETQGYLIGLDGRRLYPRKPHASLNLLLQSGGAVVMKKALVILDRDLQADGFIPGRDYEFCGNIHDEAQADLLPDLRDRFDIHALACLPKAGRSFKLLCPMAAETKYGHSWKDTH